MRREKRIKRKGFSEHKTILMVTHVTIIMWRFIGCMIVADKPEANYGIGVVHSVNDSISGTINILL